MSSTTVASTAAPTTTMAITPTSTAQLPNTIVTKQQIRPVPVKPLPIGSGGNSKTSQLLQQHSRTLTMQMAQANADTVFDPPPPTPPAPSKFVESFCGFSTSHISAGLVTVAVLCIAYGIISRR